MANKEVYSLAYSDFAKHWNARELLKSLAKINPDFYPKPVIEVPSNQPGIRAELQKRSPDFLTEKEFVEVYGRCGVIMHAANPFAAGIDYAFYNSAIRQWRDRIINLLNSHEVHLLGTPGFYMIHMKEAGHNEVAFYRFEPPSDVQP